MKQYVSGITLLVLMSQNVTHAYVGIQNVILKKAPSQRAENAKIVLANLAQMIGQIGLIIEEPKDPDNVALAVTNIVSNIVKITMHAINNKQLKRKDAYNIMHILQAICIDARSHDMYNLVTEKKSLLIS